MRIFILFLMILFQVRLHAESISETKATCDYSVKIHQSSIGQTDILADVCVYIDIEDGNDIVYIPLPFSPSDSYVCIIEPTSSKNPIFNGFFRPEENYGACIVHQTEIRGQLNLVYKNVRFRSIQGSQDGTRSIIFNLAESVETISRNISNGKLPTMGTLDISGLRVEQTYPPKILKRDKYLVPLKAPGNSANSVTIVYKVEQSQYILSAILGGMGILIGILGTPKILKKSKHAFIFLVTSSLGLLILIAIFFTIIYSEERWKDNTTIVTFGTVAGLVVGLLVGSIICIYESKKATVNSVCI